MNNLIWFRNDLRIHDNTSLGSACKGDKVMALYCFESKYFRGGDFGFNRTGKYRARFLIQTVSRLRENLAALNIPLFIYSGEAEKVIPKLVVEQGISNIYLQKEWTRDERATLAAVKKRVSAHVDFHESYDQFLFHPNDIPFPSFEQIPEIFTPFRKNCEKFGRVRPLLNIPNSLPVHNMIENTTTIPDLGKLGLEEFQMDERTAFPFIGGENEGLERVRAYFWETKKLANYKKTRNGLLGQDYSSKLSPWMANGSISPRKVYWEVKRFEKEVIKNQDTYWLIFELIWRDFFKYISLKHGNRIFKIGGIRDIEHPWKTSQEEKQRWVSGTTKEPFVNANMQELSRTGWMSNRGRQNVASYWSKQLGQDWRIGASYFESMLLDYDVHSNWGNWMYASGVGNDPKDRTFSIKRQSLMYDSRGVFQNLWNTTENGIGAQTELKFE